MHEPNTPQHRPFSDQVKVCQVGYLPGESKFAMLTAVPEGEVILRRSGDGSAVLALPVSPALVDPDSGDTLRWVDFSAVQEPGRYYLDVPGVGNSFEFAVGSDVFAKPFRLAMRSFYGQRCGIAVNMAPDFPEYHYPACHTDSAQFHPSSGCSGTIDCSGGWHDAGDYGRYVVNSGISTGSLLWAYELNASKLKSFNLDIPESGGQLPDMLAEIRWNIDWMRKMQDQDGGVWHKATTSHFPGFIMPQEDRATTFIIGSGQAPYKTTASTADFAAVCAIAGRVYRETDPQYALQCLLAAERAWTWLAKTPDHPFIHNPDGIHTGGYGDPHVADERLWAAAELFRTTGKAEYGQYFLQNYQRWTPTIQYVCPQSWGDLHNLAMLSYALSDQADPQALATIRADATKACDQIVARSSANGYRIALTSNEYIWGSNAVVANYAMLLLVTDRLAPHPEYRNAAMDCLHYLLGRNVFNCSFVTHLGSRWPLHPHHRPCGADAVREPWPGLLVGGPNADGQHPPARQWFDEQGSFTTNEVAINWNAPLIFILAEALPGSSRAPGGQDQLVSTRCSGANP